MSDQKRVLIVMSSHDELGRSGKKTGTWFEEVATPYYMLREAGHEVVLASIDGGEAPIDLLSMQSPFTTPNTDRFFEDPVAMFALRNTNRLNNMNVSDFDGMFVPGGYGLVWDLASDSYTIAMIEQFFAEEKPIAMVCHGPAVLRDAKKSDPPPPFALHDERVAASEAALLHDAHGMVGRNRQPVAFGVDCLELVMRVTSLDVARRRTGRG
jgi:putative intracellular protease/amidase